MAGIVVSASKGVIGPLLDKLTKMMEDKCANLMGVSRDIVFLRDELCTISALLEQLEDTDGLNPVVKDWRNQVREMGYDIEDLIDDFMHPVENDDAKTGFINKIFHFINNLRVRLETASKIKELKTRLKEINERSKRYKLGDCVVSSSSSVAVDPRLPALYREAANLVGIEGPREEIIKLLTDTDQQLKVLSIVGFGGLGKTTLAMEVYRKIGGQFSINGFFSVSQRPDITRLLRGIQSKLGISSPTFEVKNIIESIRVHLQDRRYFVVVDDLWDAPTWDIIRSAFPENDLGCRVIVTTRVGDVGSWACSNHPQFIYRMKPLGDQDSRKLFFNRIFGSQDQCPSQFEEVSTQILKKCNGLPLAVITIASLLASRPTLQKKEWESIRNSIGTQGASRNPTLEGMRQILYLSYKDLPHHLRTCFLYLGIYPEDIEISRDDLIRQWLGEGFVQHLHGQDSEDVAKGYFNELVNRSLIQPVPNVYEEVTSCRVHDMMLELILSRCAEDNFINVSYSLEELTGQHEYNVRRLLLDLSAGAGGDATMSETTAIRLSQVRSLQLFGGSLSVLPMWKHLRVLMLRLRATRRRSVEKRVDLTAVGEFFLLRYLKVEPDGSIILKLPAKINGLRYLSTLEIGGFSEVSLPSDIIHLPRLCNLMVPIDTRLPDGIGNMKSLCNIPRFNVFDMQNIKDLGALTNLRYLNLLIRLVPTTTVIDALVTSLGKLCKLRYLEFTCVGHRWYDENDRLGSLSQSLLHIEELQLSGRRLPRVHRWISGDLNDRRGSLSQSVLDIEELLSGWRLPRVPRWISGDLQNLRWLSLCVDEVSADGARALGELPLLAHLSLHCRQDSAAIVFDAVGFPALQSLRIFFIGDVVPRLRFEAGVMPNLDCLNLGYHFSSKWSSSALIGMEHLLNVRDIDVYLGENLENVADGIMHAFWKAMQAHRSCPTLRLRSRPWHPSTSSSFSHHFLHIEELDLSVWSFPKVPRWISGELQNLRWLSLCIDEMSADGARALGELPSLVHLSLALAMMHCRQDSAAIVFDAAGFPALQSLAILFLGGVAPRLCFEAGVMPNLGCLNLAYLTSEWSGTAPTGMEHLLNVSDIYIDLGLNLPNMEDSIMRAFWEAIQAHRSRPTLRLGRRPWHQSTSPPC